VVSRLFFERRSVFPCRAEGLAVTPFFLVGWAERAEVVEKAERRADVDDEISMDARERDRQREQIDWDIAAGVLPETGANNVHAMPSAAMNARLRESLCQARNLCRPHAQV